MTAAISVIGVATYGSAYPEFCPDRRVGLEWTKESLCRTGTPEAPCHP